MAERWNGPPRPLLLFIILPSPPPWISSIPLWAIKRGMAPPQRGYEDIHLPVNTPAGFFIGIFSLIFGFAMVWYIWWLAIVSLGAIVRSAIVRLWGEDEHMTITAAELRRMEEA